MAEISLGARILLVVVFGAAAMRKAGHIGSFRGTLLDLGIPPAGAKMLAPLIIGYEAFVAILLASGLHRFVAALLVVTLLFSFAIVSVVAHVSKRTVLCNCFGAGDNTLGLSTIARSGLLLVPAAAYAYLPTFYKATRVGSLGTSVLVGALTIGFLLVGQWILASPRLATLIVSRRQLSDSVSFSANSNNGSP